MTYHPTPSQIAEALRQLWELGGEDKFYYKLVAPLLGRNGGCWLVCLYLACSRKILAWWLDTSVYIYI